MARGGGSGVARGGAACDCGSGTATRGAPPAMAMMMARRSAVPAAAAIAMINPRDGRGPSSSPWS